MQIKPRVLDRLLLGKSFLDRIRFQPAAIQDRHTLASQIIASHDAAELCIAAICDQVDALPDKPSSFLLNYVEALGAKNGKTIPGREHFRDLNTTRNALKHQGLFPDARQWSRVGETSFGYVVECCEQFLDIEFSTLDDSALIHDVRVKRLYDDAKQLLSTGAFKEALENIGMALAYVFRHNPALRGFEAGHPLTEDAIRLAGFGVHGNDYLALQQFLPRVASWGEHKFKPMWQQSRYGHPGNWNYQNVEFCLRAFVDLVVKIQDSQWIPGALDRTIFYEQQIQALKDGVEIWRNVPVDGDGKPVKQFFGLLIPDAPTIREVIRTLMKGETLNAFVSMQKETWGDWRDGVLARNKKPSVLNVYISDKDGGNLIIGEVMASEVKINCVPKEEYSALPTIEWDPE